MTATYNVDERAFREWLESLEPNAAWPRWDCRRCPLATYLKHDTAGAPQVEVGGDGFATIDGIIGELPTWTVAFTTVFDGVQTGNRLTPGTRADALRALDYAISR